MSWLRLDLMGTAQAYLDRTSITVNKYLFPLFHRLSFCMSTKSICHCSSRSRTNVGVVGKRVRRGCGAYNSTPIRESVMVAGFGKRPDPTQGPGFMGIFVSAWQRHEDIDTRSFPFSFFNSFFTHLHDFFFSKQGHATKFFMHMAPPLTLPFLGFSRFSKLIQPLLFPLLSPGLR